MLTHLSEINSIFSPIKEIYLLIQLFTKMIDK